MTAAKREKKRTARKQPSKKKPSKTKPPKKNPSKKWFVYMIECEGDRIYTGIAIDVAARFEKHRAGGGAAFMRISKPLRVLAAKKCGSRSAALKLEYALKQLGREAKVKWATAFAIR